MLDLQAGVGVDLDADADIDAGFYTDADQATMRSSMFGRKMELPTL